MGNLGRATSQTAPSVLLRELGTVKLIGKTDMISKSGLFEVRGPCVSNSHVLQPVAAATRLIKTKGGKFRRSHCCGLIPSS